MTLQNKLTIRISTKDKRAIRNEVKQSKEITLSDYIRRIVLKDIRRKNESRTNNVQSTKA
jgi:hypothetical protein